MMNKQRRTEIRNLKNSLEMIKYRLELTLTDEQLAYDNIPESLLESKKAETSEEAINVLEDIVQNIEDIISDLGEII